jgi:hypothetical protein
MRCPFRRTQAEERNQHQEQQAPTGGRDVRTLAAAEARVAPSHHEADPEEHRQIEAPEGDRGGSLAEDVQHGFHNAILDQGV